MFILKKHYIVAATKKIRDKILEITKYELYGEMSVEETEETLIDPNGRIIRQITVEDAKAADRLFEDLMGTAIVPRKAYIKEHSKEAYDNV